MSKKKQAQPQAAVQATQTLWRQLGALPTEAPALSGEEQRALYLQAMKKAGLSAVRPAAQKPKRTLRRRWALGTAAALAVLSVGGLLAYGTGGFGFGTKTGADAADAVPQTALTSGMDTAASSQEMELFAAADSTAALGGAEQAPQKVGEAEQAPQKVGEAAAADSADSIDKGNGAEAAEENASAKATLQAPVQAQQVREDPETGDLLFEVSGAEYRLSAAAGEAQEAALQITVEADGSRSGRWTAAGRQYTLTSADAAEEAFAEVCAAVQACNGDLVKSIAAAGADVSPTTAEKASRLCGANRL